MRILFAPDKFKETATAAQVAGAMARGIHRIDSAIEVDLCPMADGGEGTVEALVMATGGEFRTARIPGPLFKGVEATWGLLRRQDDQPLTAVIEMAAASGLALVPLDKRDPTTTTTVGTGALIRSAIDDGAMRIILGIGGSATNDGGVGMAIGLGIARFCDSKRRFLKRFITGGTLCDIGHIERLPLQSQGHGTHDSHDVEIIVACDVTNPLYGPNGAAAIYAPQKGATPQQVELLDRGLRHLASLLPDVDPNLPGMGAAGGLGFGLVAFCGARLQRGIDLVMDAVNFRERLAAADLVITGEGCLDAQSLSGKTCIGVAKAHGVPALAIVGSVGEGADRVAEHGLLATHPLVRGDITLEQAKRDPLPLIEQRTADVVNRWIAADERR